MRFLFSASAMLLAGSLALAGVGIADNSSVDTSVLVGDIIGECVTTNNTCPTLNQGGLPGTFCGGGENSGCFSCDNWEVREKDCDWEPMLCDDNDANAPPCGAMYNGVCKMGVDMVMRCKPVGGAIGQCNNPIEDCL